MMLMLCSCTAPDPVEANALRATFMQRSGSKSAVDNLECEMEMIASTETWQWSDLLPFQTIAAVAVSAVCRQWGLCSTKWWFICVYTQVSPDQKCATCGLSSMAQHPPLSPWEPALCFPPCPALLRHVDTDG